MLFRNYTKKEMCRRSAKSKNKLLTAKTNRAELRGQPKPMSRWIIGWHI
jgi:hypothetical protein